MPGGPQSCPLGDFPSSLGATSPLLLSLLEPLALLVSVGCFIRTRLLTSLWISYPTASSTCLLVEPLHHHYMRLSANRLPLVAIVIKKEESPIVVPLHTSVDEKIKSEE